jgi:transcriptional regulator with XRE-family HTH domain
MAGKPDNRTPPAPPSDDWNAVARRLRELREALGYDRQDKFAEAIGVEPPRYRNAERGLPLSRQLAQIIVAKFPGVREPWLYRGDPAGLNHEMLQLLGLMPRPPA